MISKHPFKMAALALAGAGALCGVQVGRAANLYYQITLDTSLLAGNPGAPFSLDFQFNDGEGIGNGNNTAVVYGFDFGGGAPAGSPTVFGGAAGNLASSVSLTDTSAFNELFQEFAPGTTVTFDVWLTDNPNPGGTPDAFVFSLLDNTLANVPTTGLGDSLALIEVGAGAPTVTTGDSSLAGVTIKAVPEATTPAAVSLGLLGALGGYRALKRRHA